MTFPILGLGICDDARSNPCQIGNDTYGPFNLTVLVASRFQKCWKCVESIERPLGRGSKANSIKMPLTPGTISILSSTNSS